MGVNQDSRQIDFAVAGLDSEKSAGSVRSKLAKGKMPEKTDRIKRKGAPRRTASKQRNKR